MPNRCVGSGAGAVDEWGEARSRREWLRAPLFRLQRHRAAGGRCVRCCTRRSAARGCGSAAGGLTRARSRAPRLGPSLSRRPRYVARSTFATSSLGGTWAHPRCRRRSTDHGGADGHPDLTTRRPAAQMIYSALP